MPAAALLVLALASLAAPPPGRTEVLIRAGEADDLSATFAAVDELADGDVLVVRVDGFEAGERGVVEQSADAIGERCWNRFPIVVDDDERATFQYQVREDERCGPEGSCVVRIRSGERQAMIATVFGGPATRRPEVAVSPTGPLRPGSEARVAVTGLVPGTAVQAAMCDPSSCPAEAHATADESGHALLTVPVPARCAGCRLVVAAPGWRSVAVVALAASPDVRYDWRRLLPALVLAGALLAVAWRIVRTVDWAPPSEAAVPDVEL